MDQRSKRQPPGGPRASPGSLPPAGARGHSVPPEVQPRQRWLPLAICLCLALAVWAVFSQTRHFGFVNYDDNLYVYENPIVEKGLTWDGIGWAFSHNLVQNWHPLTVLSYMVDASLYGRKPGGYHLTNVALHAVAAILLFVVLKEMTGTLWRSAFVATLFAIHPLRVESVAWISERKDVLSGVFFMLTLWAYVRYVQRPAIPASASTARPESVRPSRFTFHVSRYSRFTFHVSRYYWLAVVFFALGLMSKPMLVTLPCVLLLLDYWPLNRFATATGGPRHFPIPRRLILEKLPLLALAAASCAATLFAQTGVIQPFRSISLPLRLGNALVSYGAYLGQMFWPSGLAVLYPFTAANVGVASVALALAVLAGISAGVYVLRRQCRYLLTGWLWYLIMLVPVIGMVQVGVQARADRYTYLPQIGLYILVTWGAVELCGAWRWRRMLLGSAAGAALASLMAIACAQTSYWRDSVTLWTHSLACTADNALAHLDLGVALADQGKLPEAIQNYQWALQIKPDYAEAQCNWGAALAAQGRLAEAIFHYQRALQFQPDYAEAHCNLAGVLAQQGNLAEAIQHCERALQLRPDYPKTHVNWGVALMAQGNLAEAIPHFKQALQLDPQDVGACCDLGVALVKQGNLAEAIQQFEGALRVDPHDAEASCDLGVALAGQGKWSEAIQNYQRAVQLVPDFAQAQLNWGNALASQGKSAEALPHFQQALALATAQGNSSLAAAARARLQSASPASPPSPKP